MGANGTTSPTRGSATPFVVAFCAALIAGAWGGLLHFSRQDRDQEIRRVWSENAFVATAFEEHARRILQSADTSLRFLAHEVEKSGAITERLRFFGDMAFGDPAVVQVAVADERGALRYSAAPLTGPINIAYREHFKVHAERSDAGLFIGKPVLAKATGTWVYFLSRRLQRPDGTFAGIVSIGLDPFYFGKTYGDLRIGEDRVGILVGSADHVVRVRISRGEPVVGDDISYSPVFREARHSPSGHYEIVAGVGEMKAPRFASYRAMPDFPLIVIVSALQDEVLADWRGRRRANSLAATAFTAFVLGFGFLLLRARALTRRREQEARALGERLQHAQKLEAIGTLAGGVAHDFNNMLGVILGQVEFAKEEAGPSGALRESLEEIEKAARRSVDVTRQLLAFARKQAIAPRVLDLNERVEAILRMIRRLIGERIDLRWIPGDGVWPVKIDPTQLDQLLTNLATNARDAIAGAGTVTIGTSNATVDEAWCAAHPGAAPGDYAVLRITDDGAGIRPEELPSIFEPFYTTKGMGRGTGLGLATVYGILEQNRGVIDVESAPGKGATFRLFFPRAGAAAEPPAHAPSETPTRGGSETILLVEDEPSKLRLVTKMLESLGYRVLSSSDPAEALELARSEPGAIGLLLTDVMMPKMNGRELAEEISKIRPGLRCLYMSGYPASVVVHRGVLDPGLDYLQKPFSRAALGEKVREVLDRAS